MSTPPDEAFIAVYELPTHPRDELSAAERYWDIEAVLNAHVTRSAEVGRVYEDAPAENGI